MIPPFYATLFRQVEGLITYLQPRYTFQSSKYELRAQGMYIQILGDSVLQLTAALSIP